MDVLSRIEHDLSKRDHLIDVTLDKLCARFSEDPDDLETHMRVAVAEVKLLTKALVGGDDLPQEVLVLLQAAALSIAMPEFRLLPFGDKVTRIGPRDKSIWWDAKRDVLDRFAVDLTNLMYGEKLIHG